MERLYQAAVQEFVVDQEHRLNRLLSSFDQGFSDHSQRVAAEQELQIWITRQKNRSKWMIYLQNIRQKSWHLLNQCHQLLLRQCVLGGIINSDVPHDQKEAISCLVFGYCRQKSQSLLPNHIPFYLKALCMQFYGNIVMTSKILSIQHTNWICFILQRKLSMRYFRLFPISSAAKQFDLFDHAWMNNSNKVMVVEFNHGEKILFISTKDAEFACLVVASVLYFKNPN